MMSKYARSTRARVQIIKMSCNAIINATYSQSGQNLAGGQNGWRSIRIKRTTPTLHLARIPNDGFKQRYEYAKAYKNVIYELCIHQIFRGATSSGKRGVSRFISVKEDHHLYSNYRNMRIRLDCAPGCIRAISVTRQPSANFFLLNSKIEYCAIHFYLYH